MADALGAVEDLVHEVEQMPGVQVVLMQEPPILRLLVTMSTFDAWAWDHIIERVDDLGRSFSGEISIDLEMSLAAGASYCLT